MKRLLLFVLAGMSTASIAYAQDTSQTDKGSWLIEANTGFGTGEFGVAQTANTRFGLSSADGTTVWSIGGEGGYFLAEDLALKLGLGYSDLDELTIFSYKLGAKYYINSSIPLQVDLTGASSDEFNEDPLWLGLQGGYAIFLSESVSIEPGLRYNISLNNDFTDIGIFEFRVGFAIHL